MYFIYNDNFFEQKDGTDMGSPLSPETALTTTNHQPKVWLRYVDDTFVLWQHGDDHLQEFLQHLNGLHNRILFTMEKEDDHKLPFLDVLVERANNRLKTDVYRKPTHTNLYLHYRSNHRSRVKSGIVRCLKTRADRICNDDEKYRIETYKLQDVFQSIGYPSHKIQSLLKTHNSIQRNQYMFLHTHNVWHILLLFSPYVAWEVLVWRVMSSESAWM